MTPEQSQKIERLIEATGAAPDKIERARANYERLLAEKGEEEIDRRIAKFGKISENFTRWRAERARRRAPTFNRDSKINFILIARGVRELDDPERAKYEAMGEPELNTAFLAACDSMEAKASLPTPRHLVDSD